MGKQSLAQTCPHPTRKPTASGKPIRWEKVPSCGTRRGLTLDLLPKAWTLFCELFQISPKSDYRQWKGLFLNWVNVNTWLIFEREFTALRPSLCSLPMIGPPLILIIKDLFCVAVAEVQYCNLWGVAVRFDCNRVHLGRPQWQMDLEEQQAKIKVLEMTTVSQWCWIPHPNCQYQTAWEEDIITVHTAMHCAVRLDSKKYQLLSKV